MKILKLILLFFFLTVKFIYSSEFIIYRDNKDEKKSKEIQQKIDKVEDIYKANQTIKNLNLKLKNLETNQKIKNIDKRMKSTLEGNKLLGSIKDIEMSLNRLEKIESSIKKEKLNKIKKRERKKIKKMELAISNLEDKKVVNDKYIDKLKMKVKKRKERLENIEKTLKNVTLLKRKLSKDLKEIKKESIWTYEVKKGDYLWKISNKEDVFGKGRLWPIIYKYNKEIVKNPDLIEPGWKLKIPIKWYVVKKDDSSLYGIAKKIYGDGEKWRWIYWANKGKIKSADNIEIGWKLKIPLN